MKLPSHKPQLPIQPPLIYEGMEWPELSGWHMYHRVRGNEREMALIEAAAGKLSDDSKGWLRKLNYWKPLNKNL